MLRLPRAHQVLGATVFLDEVDRAVGEAYIQPPGCELLGDALPIAVT